jgi:type VI protein secretion system component VasF
MKRFELWRALSATTRDAEDAIDRATGVSAARDLDAASRAVLGTDALEALHKRMRDLLARLSATLPAAEKRDLLFVLAIHLDEKIQRRLTRSEEPNWPLLQRALFEVHDGGELFYELVGERLRQVDASPLLLELCYFCLADGFVGRHSRNPQKIDLCKRKLAARICGAAAPPREERTTAWVLPKTRGPLRLYLATGAFAVVWPLLLLWLW